MVSGTPNTAPRRRRRRGTKASANQKIESRWSSSAWTVTRSNEDVTNVDASWRAGDVKLEYDSRRVTIEAAVDIQIIYWIRYSVRFILLFDAFNLFDFGLSTQTDQQQRKQQNFIIKYAEALIFAANNIHAMAIKVFAQLPLNFFRRVWFFRRVKNPFRSMRLYGLKQ